MTARSITQIIGGYGERKQRGSDTAPTDPVRAHSYDIDDARAKPGSRIGDGGKRQCGAFKAALVGTLSDQYEQQRRDRYDGPFPIQARHILIFRKMLDKFLFGANGDFFASAAAIADATTESEATVKRCLLTLEAHGYLCHVRRSERIAGAEGQAGPQRKQACNGFFFDCERRMAPATFKMFWRRLVGALKLFEKMAHRAAAVIKRCFNGDAKPAPRAPATELKLMLARIADRSRGEEVVARPALLYPEARGAG